MEPIALWHSALLAPLREPACEPFQHRIRFDRTVARLEYRALEQTDPGGRCQDKRARDESGSRKHRPRARFLPASSQPCTGIQRQRDTCHDGKEWNHLALQETQEQENCPRGASKANGFSIKGE